jgi:hypothetical protein
MAAHGVTATLGTWDEAPDGPEFTGLLAGNGASRAV